MKEPVGIIGVGLLGSAIAERLSHSGRQVHGYDPNPIADIPVEFHTSAVDVFAFCDTIFFSLPTSRVATAVVGEVHEQIRPAHIVIDTTTGAPEEMIGISAKLQSRGANYVEANVAGSSDLLRRNEAGLFVAGDEDVVVRLGALLDDVSSHHFYLGMIGNGSRFKLVHNLILGLHRAVLAEGLQFAESLGFDSGQTLSLLQKTPAVSGVMSTKGRRMVERSYGEPQARVTQHLKDVRLMLAEAERSGARVPFLELHRDLLEALVGRGLGAADTSAIMEAFNPSNESK